MDIRRPVARAFYPGDCEKQMRSFIRDFDPPSVPYVIPGAVVPHAGWIYSGRVAAKTWASIATSTTPETVVILGSVHHYYYPYTVAIWPKGIWETPVGDFTVDCDLAADILKSLGDTVQVNYSAHENEHSIEVQLAMVKLLFPDSRFVPIAVPPSETACEFGSKLGEYLHSIYKPVTVVATTDLTHYGPAYGMTPAGIGPKAERWMEENDHRMIDLIERLECTEIVPEAESRQNACGAGAVAAVVGSALAKGATRGELIEYTTSHRELSDGSSFSMAVGYAGIILKK